MTYATQAHLEMFLHMDVTAEPSAAVTMLLENATGLISSHIDRKLELTTGIVEVHDPPVGANLRLKQWPIDNTTTPVAVTFSGTALTQPDDFIVYPEEGRLVRVTSDGVARTWYQSESRILRAIQVTYDAGYDFTLQDDEPEVLVARDTCTRIVARAFQAAAAWAAMEDGAEALKSVTLAGSDSITYRDEIINVASAAVQLEEADKLALARLQKRVLV